MPADIRVIAALMQRHQAMGWRAPVRRGPGWYAGPFLGFANRMHGDALPSDFNPAPYEAYRNAWWTLLSPWFFVVPEENPNNPDLVLHTPVNIRVQTRHFRTFLRRASWDPTAFIHKPDPDSNQFSWTWSSYMGVNDYRAESVGNGGGTSHGVLVNGASSLLPHGYGGPPRDITSPETVTGLAMEMEHRLILDNPGGVDQRAQTRLLICLASDLYPYANAPLPTVGYWPANGASGWMRITSDWQTVGFTTWFTGVRPHMYSDVLNTWDTLSLMLSDPPPGWTDGGGGGVIVTPPAPVGAKRVMLIGDDYVAGDETASGSRSIRGALLARAAAMGMSIDAIGRGTLTPAIGGDPDHEGWPGAFISTTSNNLAARLPTMMQVAQNVDAVVLMVGLADYEAAPSGIADRFTALFNSIRSAQPTADIILYTLPPRQGLNEAQTATAFAGYAALNTVIRQIAASQYGVRVAEGATAALVPGDYVSPALLNQSGADKLGQIGADALRAALGADAGYVVPNRPRRLIVFPRYTGSRLNVAPSGDSPSAPRIVTQSITAGRVNEAFSVTLQIEGSPEATVTHTGTLPPGVTRTGRSLTGMPTAAGRYTITVTATNENGADSRTFTIDVFATPSVATTSLPIAIVGIPYTATITLGTEGPGELLVTGTPPAGMTLTGVTINGTATAPAVATFEVRPVGPAGPGAPVTLTLTVVAADAAPVVLTASLPDGSLGVPYPPTPIRVAGIGPIGMVAAPLPPGLTLLYDKSNFIANSSFEASLAGWASLGASVFEWDAGRARLRGNGLIAWCGINRPFAGTPGTRYRASATVVSTNTQLALIGRPDGGTVNGQRITYASTPGRYEVDFTARTATPQIVLECVAGLMVPALTNAFGSDAQGWTTWNGTAGVAAPWASGAIRAHYALDTANSDPWVVSPAGLNVPSTNRLVQAAIRRIGRDDIGDMSYGGGFAPDGYQLYPQGGTAVDNGDNTYTVTNGGMVRVLWPLASLAPDVQYAISMEVYDLVDTARAASVDWCDTQGFPLSAAGWGARAVFIVSRSSYDATYRFLDVNAPPSGTVRFRIVSARAVRHAGPLVWTNAELFWKRLTDSGFAQERAVIAPPYIVPEVASLPEQMLRRSGDFSNAVWLKGPQIRDDGLDGTLAGFPARRFTSLNAGNPYVAQYVPVRAVEGTLYTCSFYSDRDPNASGNGAVYVRAEGVGTQFNYTAIPVAAGVWRYVCRFAVPAGTTTLLMLLVTDAPNGYSCRVAAAQMSAGWGEVPYRESLDVALSPTGTFQPHNLVMSSEDFGFYPHWGAGPLITFGGRDGSLIGRPAWRFTSGAQGNSFFGTNINTEASGGPLVVGRTYTVSVLSTRDPAASGNGGASYFLGGVNTWHAFGSVLVAPGVWMYFATITIPVGCTTLWLLLPGYDAVAGFTYRSSAAQVNEGTVVLPYLKTGRLPIRANRGTWQPQNWFRHTAGSALTGPNGWGEWPPGQQTDLGNGAVLQGIQSRRFSSAQDHAGYFRFTGQAIGFGVPFVLAYLVNRVAGSGSIILGWSGYEGEPGITFNPDAGGQIQNGPPICGARNLGDCWLVWGVYRGAASEVAGIMYAAAGSTWDVVMCGGIGTTAPPSIVGTQASPSGIERSWLSELATIQWDYVHALWNGTIDQIRLDLTTFSSDRSAWEVDQVQIGEPGTFVVDDFEVAALTKNHVGNPSGMGGTGGVLGAGGVLPTDWMAEVNGLTRTFTPGQSIATPTGSIDAVRLRLQGTPSQPYWALWPDVRPPQNVAPARPGEQWSARVTVDPVAGTFPASVWWSVYIEEWSASGTWLRSERVGYFAGTLAGVQTITGTFTTQHPDCAGVRMLMSVEGIGGGPLDFTFRVGGWQLELGGGSSWFADPRFAYVQGTPAVEGGYRFRARARSALGVDERDLSININGPAFRESPWARLIGGGRT